MNKVYIVMVNCGAENTSNFYAEGEHKRVAYSNREQAESVAAHARLTYNNDNDDGYDWSVEVVEMPVVTSRKSTPRRAVRGSPWVMW